MTDAIMEALMAVAVGVVFIMTLGFAIVKAADAWLWLEGLSSATTTATNGLKSAACKWQLSVKIWEMETPALAGRLLADFTLPPGIDISRELLEAECPAFTFNPAKRAEAIIRSSEC